MTPRETSLGKSATFLLPSLKLNQPASGGQPFERELHDFLLSNFGGYTATQGNLFGYWAEDDGSQSYGEHRAFTVACAAEEKIPLLKDFLSRTSRQLDEECIYLELGGFASLIYAQPS